MGGVLVNPSMQNEVSTSKEESKCQGALNDLEGSITWMDRLVAEAEKRLAPALSDVPTECDSAGSPEPPAASPLHADICEKTRQVRHISSRLQDIIHRLTI